MKPMVMDDYGGPEVLELRELADPVAGDGQVLVHIHAASVNPVDWKLREGQRRDAIEIPLPHILGLDFSGVVAALGAGVTGLAVGDEVFGGVGQGDEGSYAEATAGDAGQVAAKPESLSHVEAASLALVGLTALYSLEDTAGLKSGELVLIQGGAGGVGGIAVQVAKYLGATVYATTSARNRDYVAAAQTRGESSWQIMLVEILPNARGPLIVDACVRTGYTIITIGVLDFLGLGLPPPDPDWGGMVKDTTAMMIIWPHMSLLPCVAISSLVIGFNLLADGLREISMRD